MKEKVLFIASLVGVFSPTILIFITNILVTAGVDTSGYVDIINLVAIGLSAIIVIVAIIFLNKYTTAEQKKTVTQNSIITTALDGNANLMQTVLPELGGRILQEAADQSNKLLRTAETKLNAMMNEMLPALATQTMQLVTEQSQQLIVDITVKANETISTMEALIPTFTQRISEQVAQTVRENNAHYHKMLTELKGIFNNLPATDASPLTPTIIPPSPTIDDITAIMNANFDKLEQLVLVKLQKAAIASLPSQPTIDEPVVEAPEEDLFTIDTQSGENQEESDESSTT